MMSNFHAQSYGLSMCEYLEATPPSNSGMYRRKSTVAERELQTNSSKERPIKIVTKNGLVFECRSYKYIADREARRALRAQMAADSSSAMRSDSKGSLKKEIIDEEYTDSDSEHSSRMSSAKSREFLSVDEITHR